MGFIRVIYANGKNNKMAIRANTAKYGSLTTKNKAIQGARVLHNHIRVAFELHVLEQPPT